MWNFHNTVPCLHDSTRRVTPAHTWQHEKGYTSPHMTAREGLHQPTHINEWNCCACLTNTDKTCENGSRTREWFFNSNTDFERDCRDWLTGLDTTKWPDRTHIFRVRYNSYFILAVPMRECLGEYSCMSSLFLIAILNDIFFAKRHDRYGRRVACQRLTLIIIPSCFDAVAGWLFLLWCFFMFVRKA